ncbi:MAG: calcium-translocating P-type ATPase, PMCA-type [Clostridiales bacterium]|jgi:calcium-translocating P-type ATPase|nr:calcium-translocating P-type ATPase, PMCA-type [Clostridiales bacterium]
MASVKKDFIGLLEKDVTASRLKYGTNCITKKEGKTFLQQYFESFSDPTIKILLVAFALNTIFFLKNFNWYESIGMAVAIILATFVSSISEYGSQLAFERLMEDAGKIISRVYRSGELCEIPIGEIVVGDYVNLQPGDMIPADGILIQGYLSVDQSTLNGEAKEANKRPAFAPNSISREEMDLLHPNFIFSGSVVCDGEGVMLVKKVGDNTFYGNLAKELQVDPEDSPLKLRLKDLARTISRFGYLGASLVGLSSLFNSIVIDNGFVKSAILNDLGNTHEMLGYLLKAITLAITVIVVAVPEGLPVMITVVLSSNMKRMIKDNVLVRKLVGIETAGSLNILFTDKTGTLTNGKLEVTSLVTGSNNCYLGIEDLKNDKPFWDLVHTSLVYNNSSQVTHDGGKKVAIGGNATDRALLEFSMKCDSSKNKLLRVSSIPFRSDNKYSAAQVEGDYNLTLIKGAPEKILPKCTKYYNQKAVEMPIVDMPGLNERIKQMAEKGIRLIAVATSKEVVRDGDKFPKLTLVGIIGIRDDIRSTARESVRQVIDAGVQVVMITGDARDTASAIAEEVGLLEDLEKDLVMTSDDLKQMDDNQVKKILPHIRVVARALPSDKSRLVRLAQSLGLVVGMTGDGVNDAPALKKSDVGFVMGSGTEVSKEAGDIVILDDNFMSIGKAILYGRTIFKSIRKFIIFQLTVNVCAVCVSMIGPFIGIDSAITVVQMLWINMVMDTLAGLAFAGEAPLPEYMEETPKKKGEKIINKYMVNQIFFTGIYTSILSLIFLKSPWIKGHFRMESGGKYLMTGFFAFFMLAAIFNSLNARTHRIHLLSHILKNKAFVGIMIMVTIIQMFLIFKGGESFRCFGLNLNELKTALILAASVIPVDILRKLYIRANWDKEDIGT